MQAAIDRVMQTYTMIANLNPDEERATRQKVTTHLAGKREADEHATCRRRFAISSKLQRIGLGIRNERHF
jgi:hypothetical protein